MAKLPEDLQKCYTILDTMEDTSKELLEELQRPMGFADMATLMAKLHGFLKEVNESATEAKDTLDSHDCDENADDYCCACNEKDDEIKELEAEVKAREGYDEVVEQVRVVIQIRNGIVHPTFLTLELDKLEDLVRSCD